MSLHVDENVNFMHSVKIQKSNLSRSQKQKWLLLVFYTR